MTQQEIEALRSEALKDKVGALSDMVDILKAERDALAAQVEALRSAIEPFATGGVCSAIDREDYSIMRERIKDWHGAIEFKKAQDAYNSTPQQCLREIKAKTVMGFVAFVFAQYESGEYHVTAREKYRQLNSRPQGQTVSVHNDPEYCGVLGNAEKYAESVRQGSA